MFKYLLAALLVFSLLLGSLGCSTANPQPAAKQLEKVKVAYGTPSAGFAAVWMAKEAGLFEKYGLDVDLSYIASATVLVPAVINGEIDFGHSSAPGPMNSYIEGGGTVWITSAINKPILYLLADPSIQKVEDLKGKAVGVTRIGSTTETFTKVVLKKHGLEPNKDVAILATGGTPETLAALTAGKIAAAVNGPPTSTKAESAGMKRLYDIAKLDVTYPFGGAFATKQFIAKRPETVRNFVKAYTEALYLVKTDEKKAKEVIGKYTNTTDPRELDDTYNAYAPYFEMVPIPMAKTMEAALEEIANTNAKAKTADPKEFYDDTFVKELDQSGFIKKLYEKK